MNEFELVTIRNRLLRGSLNKAQRGELYLSVPIGYIKLPSGEIALDPDEQARASVKLVFDKFSSIGSVCGVFQYFQQNKLKMGFRIHRGARKGELEWRLPTPARVANILRHPITQEPADRQQSGREADEADRDWPQELAIHWERASGDSQCGTDKLSGQRAASGDRYRDVLGERDHAPVAGYSASRGVIAGSLEGESPRSGAYLSRAGSPRQGRHGHAERRQAKGSPAVEKADLANLSRHRNAAVQ
jgi:hypothetical protein